ncbi:MAG: type II secretion system secretin GspD [Allosphingosinicella sp.]|uniref:type II secretion system secretin GspD n=1 Tax=Allosphingosinicella sp. TaxID=2823234 RepID=UPI0039413BFC
MKRFHLLAALALSAALPLQPAGAQHVLNLRDADVRAFIQDAARVTGRTIIIDPAVQGRVSVVTDRPVSRSEYFELFLSTLRANGLVAVPVAGGALRVQPVAGAAQTAPAGGARGASPHNFVTEIIRVRNVEPASLVESLRPLVSASGSITASRNSIVVADFADNVARIRQLVGRMDQDSSATRVLALRNAGAREIAESLTALVGEDRVSIVAVDSSNSLAFRGDSATVARLMAIAEELDQRAASGTEIRVIFLQHADAEQLLPVLQQLLGQPATPAGQRTALGARGEAQSARPAAAQTAPPPPPAAAGGTGGAIGAFGARSAVVTRFEGANAIIIAAPQDVQRMLGEVVRQLDTRREQVLVEAIIVEISDSAARQLGVQLLLAGLEGSNIPFAVTNYSNAAPNITTVAAAVAAERLRRNGSESPILDTIQEAALAQISGATGGIGGVALRSGNAIFGAIINAVQSDTESNVLSTPSIMTLDNQEARILVGQEVPVTTGEALSPNFDNAFRTVQRQNVGISLEVRPQINAGGAIKLDLRQEVSSIAGPVSRNQADLILNKREIQTTITVDDGEIVGIGGLLDDNERRTLERVPVLGDIPVVGNLFRSRGRARAKTNLMVFIRPTILRTTEDARRLSGQRWDYARGRQALQNPNREPSMDELLREYMLALPPSALTAPTLIGPGDEVVTPVPLPESQVPQ